MYLEISSRRSKKTFRAKNHIVKFLTENETGIVTFVYPNLQMQKRMINDIKKELIKFQWSTDDIETVINRIQVISDTNKLRGIPIGLHKQLYVFEEFDLIDPNQQKLIIELLKNVIDQKSIEVYACTSVYQKRTLYDIANGKDTDLLVYFISKNKSYNQYHSTDIIDRLVFNSMGNPSQYDTEILNKFISFPATMIAH